MMAKRASSAVGIRRRVDLDVEDADSAERADDRYLVVVAPPPAAEDGGEAYLLAGLLIGAALGAVVGLFRAPRSGEETRRQVLSRLPGNAGDTLATARRQVLARLPGRAGDPAAEPTAAESTTAKPAAAGLAGPPPSNATAAALDPLAQVAQYEAPPVRTDAPAPYHADTEPPPPQTP